MIKILIVEDSITEAELLKNLFTAEQDMEVVAWAKNGKEAIDLALKHKPDLITMDICMPVMDGIDSIRHIIAHQAIPIVVISSKLNDKTLNATFEALKAGALSVLNKPENIHSEQFEKDRRNMIDIIRSMAEIKVIKRRAHPFHDDNKKELSVNKDFHQKAFEIIGIGASVGGPQALFTIISKLPVNFSIPIVVVQHMTNGFMNGFTRWLNNNVPIAVKEAEDNELLLKGHVYFAPDHHHLVVERNNTGLRAHLINGSPVSGFCPSATVLLRSLSKVSQQNALGILLTGMGSDGAQGLLEMKNKNGHTLIQDSESTVVFGMGKVALSLGAVDKIVKLEEIADYLVSINSDSSLRGA